MNKQKILKYISCTYYWILFCIGWQSLNALYLIPPEVALRLKKVLAYKIFTVNEFFDSVNWVFLNQHSFCLFPKGDSADFFCKLFSAFGDLFTFSFGYLLRILNAVKNKDIIFCVKGRILTIPFLIPYLSYLKINNKWYY